MDENRGVPLRHREHRGKTGDRITDIRNNFLLCDLCASDFGELSRAVAHSSPEIR
jgi:hypothetical protein